MAGGPSVDDGVRMMLVLMPRLVGRAKRLPIPESLRSFSLAPRHLSLLSHLLFDGPLAVNELRNEDQADRRHTIVSISERYCLDVEGWLANGARAWQKALSPLTADQRRTFIETLEVYEREVEREALEREGLRGG
jgi:hypothetical protein